MSRVRRNYAYNVGDVANAIPNWTLTCTKAGTTSTDIINIQAGTIIDGTCEWNCVNSEGGGAVNNYSTTEQRIGTWIDGKPLYQKTIQITTPSTPNANTIVYEFVDNIPDMVVNIFGYTYVTIETGKAVCYINSNRGGNYNEYFYVYYRERTDGMANTIRMQVGTEFVNCPCYITIQYTKTTD